MKKLLGMTSLLALLIVAISAFEGQAFLSLGNMHNLLQRVGMMGIFAMGAGIVIMSGGIDLSIGSVMAFIGIVVALLAGDHWNPWLAAALVVPGCTLLGLWHAFVIDRFKLQPFLATLTTLLLLRGLARGISGGQAVHLKGFGVLGNDSWLWIPIPFWILIGIALVLGFLMNFTVYGRYLYAIGRNEDAVRYSGIKVNRIRMLAYAISAVLAGIAGVVELSYVSEVQPASAALMYEMWGIAAAVLGGCSLRGGEGSVLGVIVGVSLITVMHNGINLLGVNTEWEFAVIGVVILGGVIADAAYKLRAAKRVKA